MGQGSFGKVYKGHIASEGSSNTNVAIKRYDSISGEGVPKFSTYIESQNLIKNKCAVLSNLLLRFFLEEVSPLVVPGCVSATNEHSVSESSSFTQDHNKQRNMLRRETLVSSGDKCKKLATRQEGYFWCESCGRVVKYPVMRYRLELEVSVHTDRVVVVMFDETAANLVKCLADAVLEAADDEVADSGLPATLSNIVGTTHTLELKAHTYYEHAPYESFTCWKIVSAEEVGESEGSSTVGPPPEGSKGGVSYSAQSMQPLGRPPKYEAWNEPLQSTAPPDTEPSDKLLGNDKPIVVSRNIECRPLYMLTIENNSVENHSLANILHSSPMIPSNTIAGRDGRVQSYCGLRLTGLPTSIPGSYDLDPTLRSRSCKDENDPALVLHPMNVPTVMQPCSMKREVTRGLYTFRINGQNYHRFGSLLSKEGAQPRFAQLWFFDMESEVRNRMGAFIDNENGDEVDIIVNKQDSGPKRISELHPSYMALQYPLLFLYGEDGFHDRIPYFRNTGARKANRGFVTMKEYYFYTIQHRKNQGTTLVKGGRLFQQYLVDAYTTIEEKRIKWTRNNQDTLRVYLYHNVCDADAMTICRTYGNSYLFITFTSNPKWSEISAMFAHVPGQKAHDQPEVGTRVFKLKLTELMDGLQKKIFGACRGVVYVIEFQKRGLPHAHILLWLEDNSKCKSAAQIDDIISAELPSPTDDLDGYKVVTEYMLHGPCENKGRYAPCTTEGGKLTSSRLDSSSEYRMKTCAIQPPVMKLTFHLPDQNPITLRDLENLPALLQREVTEYMLHGPCENKGRYAPCTTEGKCTKRYPKAFYAETVLDDDGYPVYCRRDNKTTQTMGRNVGTIFKGYFIQKTKAFPISRVAANNRTDPKLLFGQNSRAVKQKWKAKIGKEDSSGGRIFRLTRNMKVNEYNANGEVDTRKQDFNQWVMELGDGTLHAQAKEERAILTLRNDDADTINAYMFNKLAGQSVTYNSVDEVCEASTETLDQQHLFPTEFLNTLNFLGMPPHALCLKKELPIMLLRNESSKGTMQWN
nr:DNA helicase PIF1, ATP-dependent [Tanacetum cinerariifolium]